MDEMRAITTSDQDCTDNIQIHNPSQYCMAQESATTNAQVCLKLSEDVGGLGQALQNAGAEFDSNKP